MVPREQLLHLIRKDGQFALFLLHSLTRKLRAVVKLVGDMTLRTAPEQLT
jgi:hypothetical protein